MSAHINPDGVREMLALFYGKLRDLADLTTEGAKQRSPYDTGNNRDSIKWRKESENEYIVFTESGYGGYLELGTVKMPARPYIKPAYHDAVRALK